MAVPPWLAASVASLRRRERQITGIAIQHGGAKTAWLNDAQSYGAGSNIEAYSLCTLGKTGGFRRSWKRKSTDIT